MLFCLILRFDLRSISKYFEEVFRSHLELEMLILLNVLQYLVALGLLRWAPEQGLPVVLLWATVFPGFRLDFGVLNGS